MANGANIVLAVEQVRLTKLTPRVLQASICATMAKGQLPKKIEPVRLADRKAILQGSLSFQEMPRLLEIIADNTGEIHIEFAFSRDIQGIRSLCGKIQTTLLLVCQRCLCPVAYPMDIAVKMQLMSGKFVAAEILPGYEPLIVESDFMQLVDIVEEEILLNLPIVAKHATEECPVKPAWEYP